MANRCLNKVMLIGNLTRDPELRYTPNGVAVCSFGLATNRRWTTQDGQTKEDAQFHRIVAWNRLAELCSQLLKKGVRVFVEGRIQYREWTGADGAKRQVAEIVIEDMIILDSRQATAASAAEVQASEAAVEPEPAAAVEPAPPEAAVEPSAEATPVAAEEAAPTEEAEPTTTDDQAASDQGQSDQTQPEATPAGDEGGQPEETKKDEMPF